MAGACGRQTANPLGSYIQCIVEFAGEVLEGDEAGELDQCVVVEVFLNPCHEFVVNTEFRVGNDLLGRLARSDRKVGSPAIPAGPRSCFPEPRAFPASPS